MAGALLVHNTLPVSRFIAMKLGALGAGMPRCSKLTPLEVLTNNTFPAQVTEQLHMLCWETPSFFIMSNSQIRSASSLFSFGSEVNGPLFLPSWNPSVSTQTTVPRLVTYHTRLPSTNGESQMPCSGQS